MSTGKPRDLWIDCARGIAIVLVVIFHAVLYLSTVHLAGPWSKLAFTLDTFRLPLFFFISGTLAGRVLALPLREVVRVRVLNFVYLYALWSVLLIALLVAIGHPVAGGSAGWSDVPLIFVWPNENLWFLYALAIFFVAGKLLRPVPSWAQIALAAAVAALFGSGVLETGSVPWDKAGRYWVFFVLGTHLGGWVRRLAPSIRSWQVLPVAGVYLAAVLLVIKLDLDRAPFVRLVLGVLAVATGVGLAVVVSRIRSLDLLRHLGTRTLPIYVVHTLPMILLVALVPVGTAFPSGLALVAVPVLVCLTIGIALLLDRLLAHRVPGLFRFPVARWIERRPVAVEERSPAQLR